MLSLLNLSISQPSFVAESEAERIKRLVKMAGLHFGPKDE